MKVTVDTITATNTSLNTDKTKPGVVKTRGGRKEKHEAEIHEMTVSRFEDQSGQSDRH